MTSATRGSRCPPDLPARLTRRRWLHGAAVAGIAPVTVGGGVVAALWSRPVRADGFPRRPVRILVGQTAGGGTDVLARMLAEKLTPIWKQPVIVENRPGASGAIGMDLVAKSEPDGHTLGMLILNHVVYEPMAARPPYRIERDLAPVIWLSRQSNILVVHPSVPAKEVGELIAWLKANPGKVSYASGGAGSPAHVAAELFRLQTGVDYTHVPYKGGGAAMQDLVAGVTTVMFAAAPVAIPLIREGRLRALGVTSDTRSPQTPDLPSLAESGLSYDVRDWQGVVVRRGTDPAIVDRINADIAAVLAQPDVRSRIASIGGETIGGPPARFAEFLASETAKWARVVREAKLTVD